MFRAGCLCLRAPLRAAHTCRMSSDHVTSRLPGCIVLRKRLLPTPLRDGLYGPSAHNGNTSALPGALRPFGIRRLLDVLHWPITRSGRYSFRMTGIKRVSCIPLSSLDSARPVERPVRIIRPASYGNCCTFQCRIDHITIHMLLVDLGDFAALAATSFRSGL